jgi:hypothetical protein
MLSRGETTLTLVLAIPGRFLRFGGGSRFIVSHSLLAEEYCTERPGAVKGAAPRARRSLLDREDRSEIMGQEGMAPGSLGYCCVYTTEYPIPPL